MNMKNNCLIIIRDSKILLRSLTRPLNIDVELQYAETIYNEFIENRAIKINYRNKVR